MRKNQRVTKQQKARIPPPRRKPPPRRAGRMRRAPRREMKVRTPAMRLTTRKARMRRAELLRTMGQEQKKEECG